MQSATVVIAQKNSASASGLAKALNAHFSQVTVVENLQELQRILAESKVKVVVLDLEVVQLDEVSKLANLNSGLMIVCTHRAPDESLWIAALTAGALEFCHAQDIRSIVRATRLAGRMGVSTAA